MAPPPSGDNSSTSSVDHMPVYPDPPELTQTSASISSKNQQQPSRQPQYQHEHPRYGQQQNDLPHQQYHHHHHHHHHHQREQKHQRDLDLHPPRNSQRFGQYVIVKTLGEGSFGKVKLAVHQVTGQKVALKIISRKKLVNKDMAGRVEREIQYLQLLRHPHIIKLYNVVTTPSEIVMVIEYAGRELFDYIVQNGRMKEECARRFFQQIICAVEYCHRHKIVHRDLKPENLLLDECLNVKIADFGLSNIMTDGNFLKTSCGSPNYAAPEVIGGKLYAGPEVDVWSCGVILYVLLCGRLPFDDEYIPNLFKKISQGSYTIPNYLSSEPVNLLRKMLVVNPVSRITIAEIRQDPWFNYNLPDYLKPQREEFISAGVDPSQLDKDGGNSKAAGELHEAVVGKLRKTMGYGNEDVHEALRKDEPNAIKDAYMIVRENQLMNSRLSNAQNIQSFLAQSPPAWNQSYGPASPQQVSSGSRIPASVSAAGSSPLTDTPGKNSSPVSNVANDVGLSADDAASVTGGKSPNSSICILPTSLPEYHKAYMAGGPRRAHAEAVGAFFPGLGGHISSSLPVSPTTSPLSGSTANLGASTPNCPITPRKTLRPLNTRAPTSPAALPAVPRPEPMTPLNNTLQFHRQQHQLAGVASETQKKPKQTRWQFGIRSRNPPLEAISCIYRALRKLGAEWVAVDDESDEDESADEIGSYCGSGGSSDEGDHRRNDYSEEGVDTHYIRSRRAHAIAAEDGSIPKEVKYRTDYYNRSRSNSDTSSQSRRRHRRRKRKECGYDEQEEAKAPEDPWIIRCRWRKDGMFAPNQKSSIDSSKTSSAASSPPNAIGSPLAEPSTVNLGATAEIGEEWGDESVYIHMDIQLYKLESNFYLVDFKCAGYERIFDPDNSEEDGDERSDGDSYSGDDAQVEGSEQNRATKMEKGPSVATVSTTTDYDYEESNGNKTRDKKVGFADVSQGLLTSTTHPEPPSRTHFHEQQELYYHDPQHRHSPEGTSSYTGRKPQEEKDVTSPFPFLDMATKLIIQLAEAD